MFGGCIADRVIVNEEEIALADMRGFAKVQFSDNSVCRYVDQEYSLGFEISKFLAHSWLYCVPKISFM